MAEFVHLHLHTEFSLLDGACRIDELLDQAQQLKMPALAVTEHGNMFSSVVFHDAARKRGINPILGCEVYVAPGDRRDKSGTPGETANHLVLLAENEKGFKNLKISTPYKTYYVLQRQSVWAEFYNAVMDACRSLGIALDSMHEEMGPGFMEATIAYGPGCRVPDDAAVFKSYAKAVAQRRQLIMTFMARWTNAAAPA